MAEICLFRESYEQSLAYGLLLKGLHTHLTLELIRI